MVLEFTSLPAFILVSFFSVRLLVYRDNCIGFLVTCRLTVIGFTSHTCGVGKNVPCVRENKNLAIANNTSRASIGLITHDLEI